MIWIFKTSYLRYGIHSSDIRIGFKMTKRNKKYKAVKNENGDEDSSGIYEINNIPHTVFILDGEIDNDNCTPLIANILEQSFRGHPDDPIHLIINSIGGDLTAALAVIDTMKGCRRPIITYGIGNVLSAALVIFMSGDYRIMSTSCSILSHQFSTGVGYTKYFDIKSASKEHEFVNSRITSAYCEATGMSEEDVKNKLLPNEDVWMSAQECLDFGLCDEVDVGLNLKLFNEESCD